MSLVEEVCTTDSLNVQVLGDKKSLHNPRYALRALKSVRSTKQTERTVTFGAGTTLESNVVICAGWPSARCQSNVIEAMVVVVVVVPAAAVVPVSVSVSVSVPAVVVVVVVVSDKLSRIP